MANQYESLLKSNFPKTLSQGNQAIFLQDGQNACHLNGDLATMSSDVNSLEIDPTGNDKFKIFGFFKESMEDADPVLDLLENGFTAPTVP